MTVSSALPAAVSDLLFASESSTASQQTRRNSLEKLATLAKQAQRLVPAITLCVALCGMACASIFIVIAEQELSPIATTFNRLLIATIAFALWHGLQLPLHRAASPSDGAVPLDVSPEQAGSQWRAGHLLLLNQNVLFPTTWRSGLAVLGLALISQVIGHGLLTYSLKQFSSGLVSVSMLAIPMLATGLAMVLFAQPLSLVNGVAFLVVLLGIYLAISAPKCSQTLSSGATTEV